MRQGCAGIGASEDGIIGHRVTEGVIESRRLSARSPPRGPGWSALLLRFMVASRLESGRGSGRLVKTAVDTEAGRTRNPGDLNDPSHAVDPYRTRIFIDRGKEELEMDLGSGRRASAAHDLGAVGPDVSGEAALDLAAAVVPAEDDGQGQPVANEGPAAAAGPDHAIVRHHEATVFPGQARRKSPEV